ncbi:TPA: hypothetical protein I7730_00025 [Vibrio vulnificus]|uniref:Uncharacterized protein n=1 Tax=Vibrio vulnificus TaxID=672 RepID=A0A8H9MYK4_VIBVL|nr:hypothetical protein [Vibrio vulnificus]HAS8538184.1 hypothetical protein [Vibrio vulnificus]
MDPTLISQYFVDLEPITPSSELNGSSSAKEINESASFYPLFYCSNKHKTLLEFLDSSEFRKTINSIDQIRSHLYDEDYEPTIFKYIDTVKTNLSFVENSIDIAYLTSDCKSLTVSELIKQEDTLKRLANYGLVSEIEVIITNGEETLFSATEGPDPNLIILEQDSYSDRLIKEISLHTLWNRSRIEDCLKINVTYFQVLRVDDVEGFRLRPATMFTI